MCRQNVHTYKKKPIRRWVVPKEWHEVSFDFHMYTQTHMFIHAHIHMYTQTNTHMQTEVHIRTHTDIFLFIT